MLSQLLMLVSTCGTVVVRIIGDVIVIDVAFLAWCKYHDVLYMH